MSEPGAILSAESVRKTYRLGRVDTPVLRGATLRVARGEWVAVLGASGSGKSTLLHLLGGLDRPDRASRGDAGNRVLFEGRPLSAMRSRELDRFRALRVGFVFQFYHLLPEMTALENTLLPAMAAFGRAGFHARRGPLTRRAGALLEAFGLGARVRHRPSELSGGERQRVAIARALVNEPAVLLADEPTGNLDRATGDRLLDALAEFRAGSGQTIVMVTHDERVAERATRVIRIVDGVVVEG